MSRATTCAVSTGTARFSPPDFLAAPGVALTAGRSRPPSTAPTPTRRTMKRTRRGFMGESLNRKFCQTYPGSPTAAQRLHEQHARNQVLAADLNREPLVADRDAFGGG